MMVKNALRGIERAEERGVMARDVGVRACSWWSLRARRQLIARIISRHGDNIRLYKPGRAQRTHLMPSSRVLLTRRQAKPTSAKISSESALAEALA